MSKKGNANWSKDTKIGSKQATIPQKKSQRDVDEMAKNPLEDGFGEFVKKNYSDGGSGGGDCGGGGGSCGGGYSYPQHSLSPNSLIIVVLHTFICDIQLAIRLPQGYCQLISTKRSRISIVRQ